MNVCSQQYLTVRRGGWRAPHIHDDFLVYGPLSTLAKSWGSARAAMPMAAD